MRNIFQQRFTLLYRSQLFHRFEYILKTCQLVNHVVTHLIIFFSILIQWIKIRLLDPWRFLETMILLLHRILKRSFHLLIILRISMTLQVHRLDILLHTLFLRSTSIIRFAISTFLPPRFDLLPQTHVFFIVLLVERTYPLHLYP